jgi:hypothetical protein
MIREERRPGGDPLMTWTDQQLAALPVKAGFRLRGLEMTRLETFCDAACASTTWSACAPGRRSP